nr:hypothetical protein [Burkholderia sp. AU16741]
MGYLHRRIRGPRDRRRRLRRLRTRTMDDPRLRVAFGGKAWAGRDEQAQQRRMQEDPPGRRNDGGALLLTIVSHDVSSL